MIESSCAPPIPFNINIDPRYMIVVDATSSAARRSLRLGLGKTVKKSDDLTLEEEEQMLASEATKLDSPTGVNNRFVYYCTRIFFIRVGKEMRDIDESMFSLLTNSDIQVFLKYAYIPCFVMFVYFFCLIFVFSYFVVEFVCLIFLIFFTFISWH